MFFWTFSGFVAWSVPYFQCSPAKASTTEKGTEQDEVPATPPQKAAPEEAKERNHERAHHLSVGLIWPKWYPLVIRHGWLEHPRSEWRFLARKITYVYGLFSIAMFDYGRVNQRFQFANWKISSVSFWAMFNSYLMTTYQRVSKMGVEPRRSSTRW